MKLLLSSFLLLSVINNAVATTNGIIWASTGGGWRSMVASQGYAQVFTRLGLLGSTGGEGEGSTETEIDTQIVSLATTSGSSWFNAQFAYSAQYYDAVANGTPKSLGEFTQKWMEAYASTQTNITISCENAGPLQELCEVAQDDAVMDFDVFSIAAAFDYSWANMMYAMFEAASTAFDDAEFVNVRASYEDRLAELVGVDMCFHASLIANMRAKEVNTITYLANDVSSADTAWTVPLPRDWCTYGGDSEWSAPLPGGNVYPAPAEFVGSSAYSGFPLYPPKDDDSLFTTPEGNLSSTISAEDMSPPFGGIPTAVQISTASSSTMAYLSEELPSYFAQYISLLEKGIDESSSYDEKQKLELKEILKKAQNDLWATGFLANTATCSVWEDPNPEDLPAAKDTSYWFSDGGYTDGPGAAFALARNQKEYGTDGEVKLIISNNNYYSNNMNNVLGYFSTSWNEGVAPGDFIWAPGVGSGPENNPWQSNQIFNEYLDEESLQALLQPIAGTNLTSATVSATTVDNDVYGMVAGQKVSILVLNINSNIPTFLLTAPMINAYTPGLVSMVEGIAGSQAFEDVISSFVGENDSSSSTAPPTPSNEDDVTTDSIDEESSAPLGTYSKLLLVLVVCSILA